MYQPDLQLGPDLLSGPFLFAYPSDRVRGRALAAFLFVPWLAQQIKYLGDIRLDTLRLTLALMSFVVFFSLGSVAPMRYPSANSVSTSKANHDRAQDWKKFSDEMKHLKQSDYS